MLDKFAYKGPSPLSRILVILSTPHFFSCYGNFSLTARTVCSGQNLTIFLPSFFMFPPLTSLFFTSVLLAASNGNAEQPGKNAGCDLKSSAIVEGVCFFPKNDQLWSYVRDGSPCWELANSLWRDSSSQLKFQENILEFPARPMRLKPCLGRGKKFQWRKQQPGSHCPPSTEAPKFPLDRK